MKAGTETNNLQGSSGNSPEGEERTERITAGQLALEIMHEIRNPLEALGHLAYLAGEEADEPEKVRTYMRLAGEQIATLSRIAAQTLGFARASESLEPVDFVDLTEAALRIHQRTIAARKIHLLKDLPQSLTTKLHSGQILQVLSNLIRNAIEALPESGTLTLRLRKHDGHVHFLVVDNGVGIASGNLERLFEPFFTTKQAAGNGLGLALSRRIIEDHHGTLRVRSSTCAGKSGSAFRVSLPFLEM